MGVVKLSTAGIVNYEKYSNFRAGIPLPPTGSFDLLETQVLASSAASVTFSSLSAYAADYKHLQIRAALTSNQANWCSIRFNADSTGSNYKSHWLRGTGSSVVSAAFNGWTYGLDFMLLAGPSSTDGGAAVVDFLDVFSSSKNTTVRALTGRGGDNVALTSGAWFQTTPVNSIEITHPSSTFTVGARFSIYGIKAGA